MDPIPEHLAVSEDESADEAVPIHIRKERKTKAYNDTMGQDIENIDTYETRTKVNTKKWRPIYEVIYEAYIKESNIFPDDFIRECKNNSNEGRFIPRKVKNKIKWMATEQCLYSQVIRICWKDLNVFATDKNKIEAKFKFQSQSARSRRWFDIDLDWIEVNFSTREPDLYKIFFQSHDVTQDNNTFKRFQVPIGNAKCVESFKFQNDAPILKYCKKIEYLLFQ